MPEMEARGQGKSFSVGSSRKWVRIQADGGSRYPSLLLLPDEQNEPRKSRVEERMNYTVRVGHRIFQGRDPRALLKLAVATRRVLGVQKQQAIEVREERTGSVESVDSATLGDPNCV